METPVAYCHRISVEEYKRESEWFTKQEVKSLLAEIQRNPALLSKSRYAREQIPLDIKITSSNLVECLKVTWLFLMCLLACCVIGFTLWRFYLSAASPLLIAAKFGSSDRVAELMRACNVTSYSRKQSNNGSSVSDYSNFHECDINVSDNEGNSALMLAVEGGNAFAVKILAQNGANLTQTNLLKEHALHKVKDVSVLHELLQHPSGRDAINLANSRGETPLHICTSAEIASMLLQFGADIEATETVFGDTPLLSHVRRLADESILPLFNPSLLQRELEIVKVLLRAKAKAEHRDRAGDNALTIVLRAHSRTARSELREAIALLAKHTNLSMGNYLHFAIKDNNAEAVQTLLDSAGSDISRILMNTDEYSRIPLYYTKGHQTARLLAAAYSHHGLNVSSIADSNQVTPLEYLLFSIQDTPIFERHERVEALRTLIHTNVLHPSNLSTRASTFVKDTLYSVRYIADTIGSKELDIALELLTRPGVFAFRVIELGHDTAYQSFILPAGKVALAVIHFKHEQTNNTSSFPHEMLELDLHSSVDDYEVEVQIGSEERWRQSNNWFGSQPSFIIPLTEWNTHLDAYFAPMLVSMRCRNWLVACHVQLTATRQFSYKAIVPVVSKGFFAFGMHLYSIIRWASILWLPVSNFGTQLAYLPFFISLAGIYTGPAFILYWLVYTLVGAILTKIGKYMYSYIIQKQDNSDILSETDDDDGEVDESE